MKKSRILPVEVRYGATAQTGMTDGSILNSHGVLSVYVGDVCVASFPASQQLDEAVVARWQEGIRSGALLEVPNEPNTPLNVYYPAPQF